MLPEQVVQISCSSHKIEVVFLVYFAEVARHIIDFSVFVTTRPPFDGD
jgi:hypothetical protein